MFFFPVGLGDETLELILLSSFPNNLSVIVITISSWVGGVKLTFELMHNLILGEHVSMGNTREASNSLLSIEDRVNNSNIGVRVVEDRSWEGEVNRIKGEMLHVGTTKWLVILEISNQRLWKIKAKYKWIW